MISTQHIPELLYPIITKALMDEDFFFIQIGSNDGKRGDPIYEYVIKYKWRGILIEPVPYLYEKLKNTYAGQEGLDFENIAIADKDGYKTFYRVEEYYEPGNPLWYDQLGSFRKEVLLKHRNLVPNLEKHLISEQIPCLSFNSLLQERGVTKINLLHIDTEGYDYEIIKTIPFGLIKPYIILYEHKHLSREDKQACVSLLTDEGYRTLELHSDTVAYL
jgi:FkbM family methyltransferase